ncbi:type I restriction endonuclease subunit R [Mesorhizobium sp. M2E.F.Ca.ET.209.01.1.1]|uniref:type I restriction endonuclease subunit R n=2 Tax=unclassified Mesorhizobium TaxID=325217 RepID=UPI001FED67CE|nr:type I restriction endonuclease subunit R [Mesorhizobium sp. M2E.F.Ca.ET.209.01.1.1]
MAAAYAGVRIAEVSIISVSPINSIRVRLRMPKGGAERLLAGVSSGDQNVATFFEDIPVLRAELAASAGKADVSERGLEDIVVRELTERAWILGEAKEYDKAWTIDLVQLRTFIAATQPALVAALDLDGDSLARQKFLARLQGEIGKRGVIDVLRNGVKHGAHDVNIFYGTPSPGNIKAAERFALNRFSVTRQLRYSRDDTAHALDIALFINGLPIATFELKNSLTKQTVEDAVEQYKRDRDPREKLFEFGRCIVHFAVDDAQVKFCTQLKGKASWFLPFNKGWNDGAGNPPNPAGLKTDYLWKDILTPSGLADIIENYAQIVERKDPKTNRTKRDQLFPRFHQLDVVRRLLADAKANGAGRRVLIQHSAGSGKSNSIAWLAHQLVRLADASGQVFDSVIVVTDRRILDQQIRDTIKQFVQVGATVGHAERSGDLRRFITDGKKIIITTVQKFPLILDDIGALHKDRRFAIIIDEAHSSQGGKASAALNAALTGAEDGDEDETIEDKINAIMERRKMLPNASYFAFTATPKNKTLEIFGEPFPEGNAVKHRPFHSYTMKQAIQEGFILDVLRYYTPVNSYYRLVKTVDADPEFDTKRATKKLRRYVESNDHAIRLKAEIMVDHFHEQVLALNKIGGQARAMVVTSGIERAIQYYQALSAYLVERKSPYRAIVAFSGDHEFRGAKVNEASLNGFPSRDIADLFEADPYRFLICADKFQTGYDQPLLHSMYVDKALSGIKAVQTLSRLNRAHPQKYDAFVLDFLNDTETIRASFDTFYRTTILSDETDPNRLHDLKDTLDRYQVYDSAQIDELVGLYLSGADRDQLDPILDACVAAYNVGLDEDGQVDFKGKAKAFARTYAFVASILPYTNAEWEKLSIFLNFLLPKLPAPREEDLSKGILEAIDMDSYRVEKQLAQRLQLTDGDAEVNPAPMEGSGQRPEPELDRLSNIIRSFNDLFGNIPWADTDRIRRLIATEIPDKVAANAAYQNAKQNSDKQNARIEHDKALAGVIVGLMRDDTELFKQFSDNPEFKRWLTDTIFSATYERSTPPA